MCVGYFFIVEEIGHTYTKFVREMKMVLETTRAGLRLAISTPICGLKSIRIISPISG